MQTNTVGNIEKN